MQVLDYAGNPPSPAQIKAAGFAGVVRYLAPLPNSKVITLAEADREIAAGLQVGLVWETTANACLGGAKQGNTDGLKAAAQARNLNAPKGVCVYLAVDFDAQANQLPVVAAYMDAARHQLNVFGYRQGVYGSANVCSIMLRDGHADLAWQTVAWSHGSHLSGPQVALYQRSGQVTVGVTRCDVNDVLLDDWGQWPRPTELPADNGSAHREDFLMPAALDDDDARRALVRQWFWQYLGRGPNTSEEQALHVWVFGTKGADVCLAGIVDSTEAAARRKLATV
jgi:hypothetical protein